MKERPEKSIPAMPVSTAEGPERPGRGAAQPFWLALASHVGQQAEGHALANVSHLEMPPAKPVSGKPHNFAALVLQDGTVGLTYVGFEGALAGLRERLAANPAGLAGVSPLTLVHHYQGNEAWERAIGMAAINAISQSVLTAGPPLADMPDTLEVLAARPGERIGMVGHFGRLIDPIVASGAHLTVLELKPELVRTEPGLSVTLNAAELAACQQVVVTGTTLINGSLDAVLSACAPDAEIHLLGPSASCLPGPLHERGVSRVGGFQVTDTDAFLQRWRCGERWRDAGRQYQLLRPG